MVLPKLVISNLSVHRVRAALTICAIALSVSLVVAVTTGYNSSIAAASKFLGYYMGAADLQVTRSKGDPHGTFSEALADEMRKDRRVQLVLTRYGTGSLLLDEKGKKLPGRPIDVIGVRRPEDTAVESLQLEAGSWFNAPTGNVCVIDQILAQRLKATVGSRITFAGVEKPLTLQVVGVAHKPAILAADQQTAYLPLDTLQQWLDRRGEINRIMITLVPGSDVDKFKAEWTPRVEKVDPLLAMKSGGDMRKQMDSNLHMVHLLAYLGSATSLLAATFIIFSALSMGVGERQRTLAMLRAVGAFKLQLAMLVILEGLIIAGVGVAIGAPLGWLWMKTLATWKSDFFSAGVVIDWQGVAFGAGAAVLAALGASLLPAWAASRVDPLAAMNPLATPSASRVPWRATVAGILCIALEPLLIFSPVSKEAKFYGHLWVALPALMLGVFLISPMFVWLFERIGSGALALMFGLRPALLRQQLTSGIWRAAGTGAALMVGLAILIVMQVQGHSILQSWRLPTKFPDIFIVSFEGLSPEQQHRLESTPGIRRGGLMPIAITAAVVSGENIDVKGANLIPQAAMFFGVDPDKALDMLELEFRDANGKTAPPEQQKELNRLASEDLKRGRHLIITDEYRRLLGKNRGDKLVIQTPMHGNVEYTIAGVVWSPGIDVIVSMFDMDRQFDQRTASSMFGSLDDARNDFGIKDVTLFAANLDYGVDKKKLVDDMQEEANKTADPATRPTTAPVEEEAPSLLDQAKSLFGKSTTKSSTSRPADRLAAFTGLKQMLGMSGMQAGDIRQIKWAIQNGFEHVLAVLSCIAFASMAVAALGVTNTIMASIRSRRWQFGILRSVGVTRSQLLRLVLAEALLLGLVGCALGTLTGFLMVINERGLSRYLLGFVYPFNPPWHVVGIGTAAVLLTALIASIWPASSLAKAEPLTLLQAGRAAA
jgi:putative ABC transport system permease protein